MTVQSLGERMSAAKDRTPRAVKDVVRVSTRAYGVASARWRPYPDFLIVGTKRGGTTSLWNYLATHSQVLPMFPAPRGLKSNAYFFENVHRSDRWYRSHFHSRAYRRRRAQRVGPVVSGEASPYYMYGPHIPRRIAAVMPDVRIIVLLRDPVDRAYGHYQERVKQGVEALSFEDALAAGLAASGWLLAALLIAAAVVAWRRASGEGEADAGGASSQGTYAALR
jgi:hypothetical protein